MAREPAGSWEAAAAAAARLSQQVDQLRLQLSAPPSSTGADASSRQAALSALPRLCRSGGRAAEPHAVPLLPLVLQQLADGRPGVREAALSAALDLQELWPPPVLELVLPDVLAFTGDARTPQSLEGGLRLLAALADAAPGPVAGALPDIAPLVTAALVDDDDEVCTAAVAAGEATYSLVGNSDIIHLAYDLLHCAARPRDLGDVILRLRASGMTQPLEAPALAVLAAPLRRALAGEGGAAAQRAACTLVGDLSRLVSEPRDALTFLPPLLQASEAVPKAGSGDATLRTAAVGAAAALTAALQSARADGEAAARGRAAPSVAEMSGMLAMAISRTVDAADAEVHPAVLQLVARLGALMAARQAVEFEEWRDAVAPYLAASMGGAAASAVVRGLMSKVGDAAADADAAAAGRCDAGGRGGGGGGAARRGGGWEDGEGDSGRAELCDCRFSLAYGGKVLLTGARLRLLRGRRYGLCGANGVGKSTLLRAISRGQLDGFPPASQLRTVYVEHDIQASHATLSALDYILSDPDLSGAVSPPAAAAALASVGFSPDAQTSPITSLSGGWKMKLALARAMLLRADVLLLDEPTNHLDVDNVEWLINYLVTQHSVTSVVVSHDSRFLDAVCTDIILYEAGQLARYIGNLGRFVEAVPAAAAYYVLQEPDRRFRFPTPGVLDGIYSREKPIVKLTNVGYTFPGCDKPQLAGVSVMCRLSSRVAVLGANGAGKSTLARAITGENKATSGTVWRHPNLRMAYVAQHAFHHLEEHLDTTPLKYIYSRYSTGEDKEDSQKVNRALEEEDKRRMAAASWVIDGHVRRLDAITGRRKKKKDFEYEVSWQGLSSIKFNRWIPRAELVDKGFTKLVNEYDQRKAAAAVGSDALPLTRANVEKFLSDFGLPPEFAVHSNIRGLSSGQKVKLVLAAAMWNHPHLLIMDEPTNYLDRESLGALATAIREFDGGVVLISHNSEFTGTCCNETWRVEAGRVEVTAKPLAGGGGGGHGGGGGGSSGGGGGSKA